MGSHVPGLLVEVDAVPREGETVLGRAFSEPEDGGKATNQAVAAAKLGAPVRVVTLVGDDERGRRWRAVFERYGLDTRWLIVVDGTTDVGFVMLPPSRIPAIVSTLDTSAALDGAAVERQAQAFHGASYVLCQLEAVPECALAAFRCGRGAGARTILNAAPAQPLDRALLDLVDVLVVNEHEAATILGRDGDLGELASALSTERGDLRAIVTAGADGCYVADGGRVEHHTAPRVEPADTTGAGDQFVAALAVRLRAGDELAAAVAFAVRAAALSVTRPGTMPAFATAAEVADVLQADAA
ncbi:MAG: PfkB family carbohydrate kinase [Gaiellaceae bacterium]